MADTSIIRGCSTGDVSGCYQNMLKYVLIYMNLSKPYGRDESVGTVTGYGLDGPRNESLCGGGDFPHLSRPALEPTQPPVQWVPGLSRGLMSGRGVSLTPHPLLVPWSRKSRAIPLLPVLAVRPVQSLTACTRVHFTFFFTLQCNHNGMLNCCIGGHWYTLA